jgi:hypothetical protein
MTGVTILTGLALVVMGRVIYQPDRHQIADLLSLSGGLLVAVIVLRYLLLPRLLPAGYTPVNPAWIVVAVGALFLGRLHRRSLHGLTLLAAGVGLVVAMVLAGVAW